MAQVEWSIQTQELRKEYRIGFWMKRFLALDSLTLNVARGESFGFVGPNGAGKTTTIKILAGLHDATSGKAQVLGRCVSDPKARFGIGFLPERPYFYVHLTARELLHFYGKLYDMNKTQRERRIAFLLERTDMTRFADIPLGKYSKGMLQRIGLCQALIHEPELIILDEPMSGLDPLGRALVRDIILEQKEQNKTIFFSSHVLSDVETICDRVGIIVGGRLRSLGTLSELSQGQKKQTVCTVKMQSEMAEFKTFEALENGRRRYVVDSDKVSHLIRTVLSENGVIESVSPLQVSLETVLVDEIQKSAIDQKHMGVWT